MKTVFRLGEGVEYQNKEGDQRYACPMTLIHGETVAQWLDKNNPEKKLNTRYFLDLREKITKALTSQIHKQLFAMQDSNLENCIIEDDTQAEEIIIIDFGNAMIFDNDDASFREYCAYDCILYGPRYFLIIWHIRRSDPYSVQNEFWYDMYYNAKNALNHFKPHKSENSTIATWRSAYELVKAACGTTIPPFLKKAFGKKGPRMAAPDIDKVIERELDKIMQN